MKRLPLFALVVQCALSASIALAEEFPVANWVAPPFWTAPSQAAPGAADPGGVPMVASATEGRRALAGPTALPFIALPPCRLVDTRGNGAPLTGGFLPSATVRSYTLSGVCGLPANAQAVSLNATVVKPVGPGFLVLYPEGGAFPPVSTLNYLGNDVIVNAAVVPLSVTGGISIALGVSGGDVLLDTNGYYAQTPTVTSLNTLTGDVTLAAGSNVTIVPSAGQLTIASPGSLTGVTAGTGIAISGGAPSPTVLIPPAGIQADRIASGQVVKNLNGLTDVVTIAGTGSVTVQSAAGTITISTPAAPVATTAYGGNVVTTVDSTGNVGQYAAISIGADGLPVASYYDATNGDLKFLKCGNPACSAGNSVTTVDSAGIVGLWTSVTVPGDGLPAISYYDQTNGDLKFVKCGNAACTSGNTIRTLDSTGNVGTYTSIAIGDNGFPTIAYRDETGNQLKFAFCTNASGGTFSVLVNNFGAGASGTFASLTMNKSGATLTPTVSMIGNFGAPPATAFDIFSCFGPTCNLGAGMSNAEAAFPAALGTSAMVSPTGGQYFAFFDSTNGDLRVRPNAASVAIDTGGILGQYPSLALLPDGTPVVSYYDATNGDLKIAKCGNAACSAGSLATSVDTAGDVGQWTSLTIGADGLPVVAYFDVTNADLKVLKCGNAACSTLSGRR